MNGDGDSARASSASHTAGPSASASDNDNRVTPARETVWARAARSVVSATLSTPRGPPIERCPFPSQPLRKSHAVPYLLRRRHATVHDESRESWLQSCS